MQVAGAAGLLTAAPRRDAQVICASGVGEGEGGAYQPHVQPPWAAQGLHQLAVAPHRARGALCPGRWHDRAACWQRVLHARRRIVRVVLRSILGTRQALADVEQAFEGPGRHERQDAPGRAGRGGD